MAKVLFALLVGLIFGAGISISGMINPTKVLNFFDIAGAWDPSLAFVMAGALLVTMIGYRIVLKRNTPVLAEQFHLPANRNLDTQLLAGAAIFGIGWGLSGFCPGGSIPALGLGQIEAVYFVLAMISGIGVTRLFLRRPASTSLKGASAMN